MSRSEPSLFSHIATELDSAEDILDEIQAQKRAQRDLEDDAAEIKDVLREHPAIRKVVVLAREDAPGQKQLVAYVVSDPERSPVVAGRSRYCLPNNVAIIQQNKWETDATYREIFQDQVYLKHGVTVQDGDCVFDVGANIGLFVLWVQQLCRNVTIYAFEPAPPIFEILSTNTRLYRSPVKLFDCGLSDVPKTASFTFYPWASQLSGYYVDDEQERELRKQIKTAVVGGMSLPDQHAEKLLQASFERETFVTPLKSLSDVLAENDLQRVDLLKIDAVKSEPDVLAGIEDGDWDKIRQIVVKVRDARGDHLDRIVALLKQQGYRLVVDRSSYPTEPDVHFLYALWPSHRDGTPGGRRAKLPLQTPPVWGDALLSSSELRSYLRENYSQSRALPTFVFLDALPVNSGGQVDLGALPAPDEAHLQLDDAFVAPRTPAEERLVEILAGLLDVDRVGIHENFFDLGGSSLLAIQALFRVREAFSVELPLTVLFANTFTVAELAKAIAKEQINQADAEDVSAMLEELDGLSDEEVKALLASEGL